MSGIILELFLSTLPLTTVAIIFYGGFWLGEAWTVERFRRSAYGERRK